ncbi:MAG: hypothetical protein IT285_03095 [Bdellovibrionales bacterium]|nr:hypothetical protein [Bdellovibrionales bacterium]
MVFPESRISAGALAGAASIYLGFSLLLVFWKEGFEAAVDEDAFAEWATCLALFVTSGFLAASGWACRSKGQAWPLFLASIAFFWAAGEEISWGQRIFSIPTPEALLAINDQGELNLHNVDKQFFDRVLERACVLLAVGPALLHLAGRERLFGYRLPDAYLVCAFTLASIYYRAGHLKLQFYYLSFLVLAVYGVAAFVARRWRVAWASVGVFVLSFGLVAVNRAFRGSFPAHNNGDNEVRELVFCLLCLAYAVILWRDAVSSLNVSRRPAPG